MLAHGARGFILDRAGHYLTLVRQIHGARHIDIGADDSHVGDQPMGHARSGERPPLEKIAFLYRCTRSMMGDEGLSTLERAQLGAAIRAVYATAAIGGVDAVRVDAARRAARPRGAGTREGGDLGDRDASCATSPSDSASSAATAATPTCSTSRPTSTTDSPLIVFDMRRCPDVVLKPVMFCPHSSSSRAPSKRHRDENRDLTSPARRADVRRAARSSSSTRLGISSDATRRARTPMTSRGGHGISASAWSRHHPAPLRLRHRSTAGRCCATPRC